LDPIWSALVVIQELFVIFFSSRRRHTSSKRDWSSDVCSSDLLVVKGASRDGLPYSIDDVDYILGVHIPTHTAFLIPNNSQTEYWSKDWETARKKWTELTI